MTTKSDLLARHLLAGGTSTRATALVSFKIANLPAEISTLRVKGYRITTNTKPDDGTGSPYTVWSFAGTTRKGSIAEAARRQFRA